MNGALEFIMRLTDQMSPALRQAASVADNAAVRIQRELNQSTQTANRFSYSLNDLRSRLNDINNTRMSTTIPNVFRAATEEARRLEAQIERIEGRTKSSGGGIFGSIRGMATGLGIYELGKSVIGGAAEREQQRVSFSVMTGSQKAGDKLLTDINAMGAATPFQNNDLIKNAQTMKAFGIETDNILPTLRMLGDVSGGNAEKLQGLTLAYSQVQSTGRLMGQDLLQMINQGFNPLQIISQQTGKSMAVLKKEMEDGAITSGMVTKAFEIATGQGGMFHNMMEKQSQTIAGRWSTLVDNINMKLVALGQILSPVINFVIDLTNAIISSTPVMIGIATVVGAITLAIYGVTWATSAWGVAQGIVNAIMKANPLILIISLILGAILWIYKMVEANKNWGTSLKAIWEITKSVFGLMWVPVKMFWEDLTYWFSKAWYTIKDWGETVWQYMQNLWTGIKKFFTDGWDAAKAAINQPIETEASKQLIKLEKEHGAAQAANVSEMLGYAKSIQDNYNKIDFSISNNPGAKLAKVTPITANAGGKLSTGIDTGSKIKEAAVQSANTANSGGQRTITININKQVGAENIHLGSGAEAADNIEKLVREAMRRTILSLNNAAA